MASKGQSSIPPSPAPLGATITHAYAGREVKVYGITESEVQMVSMFNTLSTTFFSLAAALPSIAIGIWTNAAFAEKATAEGNILSKFVGPALCVIAVVFFVLAIWARMSRGSTWDFIRQESKQKP